MSGSWKRPSWLSPFHSLPVSHDCNQFLQTIIALVLAACAFWRLTVNFIIGCVLWLVVIILCINLIYLSHWTRDHRKLFSFIALLFLIGIAWYPAKSAYIREFRDEVIHPLIRVDITLLEVDVQTGRIHFQERNDLGGIVFVLGAVSIENRLSDRRMSLTAELYVKLAGGSTIILKPYFGPLPKNLDIGSVPVFQPIINVEPSNGTAGTFVFVMEKKTISAIHWPNLKDYKQIPKLSINIIERMTQRERLFDIIETMTQSNPDTPTVPSQGVS